MTMELSLSIASFALSVGGLVAVLRPKAEESRRKLIILAVIIALLIPTTGITVYRLYHHQTLINNAKNKITEKLKNHVWTFDQLYNELHYIPYPIVSEALFRAVQEGAIGHKILEFRSDEGMQQVKGYYINRDER